MNFDFGNPTKINKLKDKFMEPPFSVLNTRTGHWQDRKREWKKLGILSHLGREDSILKTAYDTKNYFNEAYGRKPMTDTSIFDPALCELIY